MPRLRGRCVCGVARQVFSECVVLSNVTGVGHNLSACAALDSKVHLPLCACVGVRVW